MRLADFIRENTKSIIGEWESFAKTLTPAADSMSKLQLKDHIEQILSFIAKDIASPQTAPQQIEKSHGESDNPADSKDSAAETHGDLRHADGFNIVQMVSEYRALRASIIKLWTKSKRELTDMDVLDLTRFNESIDQALAESVVRFMDKVDYSRNLTLGVLGHDIRSPLGAINMAAQIMLKKGLLNEKNSHIASLIETSSTRALDIVTDLLDLTRARLGTGLAVLRQPMDMGTLAQQLVDEMCIQYPNSPILLQTSEELEGEWDVTRLGQVFSNLIGNAVQYSSAGSVINVILKGDAQEIIITIQNQGRPIPPDQLGDIFNSFNRGGKENPSDAVPLNLGLGLFITKEIVLSHGGSINVVSNEKEGTVFSVRFPRSGHPAKATKDNDNFALASQKTG